MPITITGMYQYLDDWDFLIYGDAWVRDAYRRDPVSVWAHPPGDVSPEVRELYPLAYQ